MMDYLIHSAIEHYAVTRPEHPALSLQGKEMSYGLLDLKSNQFAHVLIDNGVVVGDRVGIYMHKSLELGVAIYGILKAGCVFVPLDPFMPADRLQLIIDDCGIEHIVSSDALSQTFYEISSELNLCVYGTDEALPFTSIPWSAIASYSQAPINVVMIDQNLGYIMYTSGSTGIPKGCLLYTSPSPRDLSTSRMPSSA